jgi:predicted RNase H-like nuclease
MRFIGIDLAWTYKNETGICVIDYDKNIVCCEARNYSNTEIASIVRTHSMSGATVTIDAPLIVHNPTGSRLCEQLLWKNKIPIFRCSKKYFHDKFGDNIRGIDICSSIMEIDSLFRIDFNRNDKNIIETFPSGICRRLFPQIFPYKIKNKDTKLQREKKSKNMKELLFMLENEPKISNIRKFFDVPNDVESFSKKQLKHMEDKIDAVLCAYCAYLCYF